MINLWDFDRLWTFVAAVQIPLPLIHLDRYIMNSQNDQLPVSLIAQLVE